MDPNATEPAQQPEENPVEALMGMTAMFAGARRTDIIPFRMAAECEITRRDYRKKALSDFWWFVRNVIGLTNLYEPFHRPICEMAQTMVNQLHLRRRW